MVVSPTGDSVTAADPGTLRRPRRVVVVVVVVVVVSYTDRR